MYPDNCLCIIACGKNKRSTTSTAQHMYKGTSFTVRRNWAVKNFKNWCILSAKYSILLPSDIIDPYDVQMKELNEDQRKELFDKGLQIIQNKFPECDTFYLVLPAPYDKFQNWIKPLGKVIFPLEGMQGRSGLHWMITGNSNTVDVDKVLQQVTSELLPGKGYSKSYILSLIKQQIPEYSPTHFKRILNSSTIDGQGEKGLRFRRIFEIHNDLYYLADTYAEGNSNRRTKKLF